MKGTERTLTLIASVITILNFSITFPYILDGSLNKIIIDLRGMGIPLRMVATTILEVCLGYAFGFLFRISAKLGSLILSLMVFSIIGIISAWVSIFNLEKILVGFTITSFAGLINFAFLVGPCCFLAIFFIEGHFAEINLDEYIYRMGITTQGISFLLIYLSLFSRLYR